MAPIDVQAPASLVPTAVVGTHVFLVGYLSAVALRTVYRSYLALPPSSATRHREPLRRGHVQTFSILALAGLVVGFFFAVNFSGLSYRVWAAEREVELPEGFFGDKGALGGGEHPGRLHIVRWLNDTPLYQDVLEIVFEKARHAWWGQQINLGFVSWSTYLAIESRRRKISNSWVFLALSQLVNLSYAQNLFFVAVLLTPVPLPENVKDITRESMPVTSTRLMEKIIPTKPDGFLPHPAIYIILFLENYFAIFLVPYAANTPSFMTVVLLSRVLPLSYLVLPYVIPTSWGTVPVHPHDSHKTYNTLFCTISAFSALLYVKSTFNALDYNSQESYTYRHSLLHPFENKHLSAKNRFAIPLTHLFTAITEHPAVSAVGLDVLISGLSLGIWSAIRGLDGREMLAASIPFVPSPSLAEKVEDVVSEVKEEAEKILEKVEKPAPPTIRRRPGRPRKVEQDQTPDTEDTSVVSSNAASPTPKRRGRPPKKKSASIPDDGERDDADASYEPTENYRVEEGDEDEPEDWEAAALAWGTIVVGGQGLFLYFNSEKDKNYGFLSRSTLAPFEANGISWAHAEQYVIWNKAMLFGDKKSAAEMLLKRSPAEVKELGDKISGFNQKVWEENRKRIVEKGNFTKFSESYGLKKKLLATGNAFLTNNYTTVEVASSTRNDTQRNTTAQLAAGFYQALQAVQEIPEGSSKTEKAAMKKAVITAVEKANSFVDLLAFMDSPEPRDLRIEAAVRPLALALKKLQVCGEEEKDMRKNEMRSAADRATAVLKAMDEVDKN
ncbi:hypothetical protein G7Y89_g8256 [Cudoniella acicularis]|uniref:NADAR domain-containing protein n=1 Tax=Cudoniella acicularis TaxID=354080 RepID=A0A8H4RJG2_9HELO|nr:hypothetical protein G7Y89_g8256 [Cudoniella acicularis]